MKKQLILVALAAIVVIGLVVLFYHKQPQTTAQNNATTTPTTTTISTSTTAAAATAPSTSQALENEAWSVFQNYLTAAKNHDLATLTNLSYQLSATCKDPSQQAACFQKMDAAYTAAKDYQEKDFTHILSDNKQIILYTDWGQVYNSDVTIDSRILIYFTRTSAGTPQLLSFNPSQAIYTNHVDTNGKTLTQAQIDSLVASAEQTDNSALQKDSDNNGWWDSIQQLFYTSTSTNQ